MGQTDRRTDGRIAALLYDPLPYGGHNKLIFKAIHVLTYLFTTQNDTLFIDISASSLRPSSKLTSGC